MPKNKGLAFLVSNECKEDDLMMVDEFVLSFYRMLRRGVEFSY
jgi:hypothetical protein